MKKLALTLPILAFLSTTDALAFNDDYVQAGYSVSDSKFIDSMINIKASKSVYETVFITGEYSYSDGQWSDPGEREEQTGNHLTIKAVKTFSINENTQPLIGIGYTSNSYSKKTTTYSPSAIYKVNFDSSFNEVFVGVRHKLDMGLEIKGTASITTNESGIITKSYKLVDLEATHKLNDTYRVGAEYKYLTDDNSSNTFGGLFIRADF
jgi:opacity protein-like surface antigen